MPYLLTLQITEENIPLLSGNSITFPETLSPGSSLLASIAEQALVGKTEDATITVGVNPDGLLTETLTVTDNLGLGIPALLVNYTKTQAVAPFLVSAFKDLDPNGFTIAAKVTLVAQPPVATVFPTSPAGGNGVAS